MRSTIVGILLLIPVLLMAQNDPTVFWFQFTDKGNSTYSLDEPLEFLSQRALERRTRQKIALDSSDLPVNSAYIQAVLAEGAGYLTHSKWFNSVSVIVPNDDVRDSILNLPFVINSEPVGKRYEAKLKPEKWFPLAETKSLSQSGFTDTDYGSGLNQIDMLGGISLHNQGYRGAGITIAVLDAGFPNVSGQPAFASLQESGRLLGGWDFVQRNNSFMEDHPHGMNVLSTMASHLPGAFIGTAPEANYLLIRTEDAGSEYPIELDYWIAGAEFADSAGADIINSSLGYTTFDDPQFDFSYTEMDGNTIRGSRGADIAASKGMLVVNSAGNSGNKPWQYIGAPADGDSVLAVGAVNSEGFIANFSSEGPSADGDVKPNVCAQGFQATIVSNGGDLVAANGTSFAGPIIAGMAACLWQANYDSATNMDIFRAIERSAHRAKNPDGYYGYGIPNFVKANLILSGINPSDPDESELFPIYPNPFNDSFRGTFYSAKEQDVVIRLVNNLGQEVRRINAVTDVSSGATFTFNDLQWLHEGVYILQVESDSGKYFQKLVKVRD